MPSTIESTRKSSNSNKATQVVTVTSGMASLAFELLGELGGIAYLITSGTPPITLQFTPNDGTTWIDTGVTADGSASTEGLISLQTCTSEISGFAVHGTTFRWNADTSSSFTIYHYSHLT